MKTDITLESEPAALPSCEIAKTLAPEDIQVGDMIAVLSASREIRPQYWNSIPGMENRRVSYIPTDGGAPQRVKAICLPFVFVKHPSGHVKPLDIRLCEIARLSPTYARVAWNSQRRRFKRKPPKEFRE
jgi:hypothetical protein